MATFSEPADAMLKRMASALSQDQSPKSDAAEPQDKKIAETMRELALVDLIDPSKIDDFWGDEAITLTRPASKAGFAGMYTLPRRDRFDALASFDHWSYAFKVLHNIPVDVRVPTRVQRFFELILAEEGMASRLSKLGFDNLGLGELYALREANERALALGAEVLSRTDVDEAIEEARAVAPFEHLLTEHFVGREDELDLLRAFLGMVSGRPALSENATDKRLLAVEGGGGSGKTALLGHFLLRSREENREAGFPFVYIACDDPTIVVQRPETIISEAGRQLMQQFRLRARRLEMVEAIKEVEDTFLEFQSELSSIAHDTADLGSSFSQHGSQLERFGARASGLRQTGRLLAKISSAVAHNWNSHRASEYGPAPVLLIVDTFEQLQYRAQSTLSPFWQTIEAWFDHDQDGRLFISGRPPMIIPAELDRFLLRRKLGDLSLDDGAYLLGLETGVAAEVAKKVVEKVGANPLDIRLTARIIKEKIREREIAGEVAPASLSIEMSDIGQGLVRGRLYNRLIDHIHPDIRALANPGMILRRISPLLIERVLAPALGIKNVDSDEAQRLYDLLSIEQTLVTLETDTLIYRPDVRGPVLRLLEENSPALVKDVQERAIELLRSDKSPEWRAEAIYHLLMLDRLDEALSVWSYELAPHLDGAVAEIPLDAKLWLAERMDVSLDAEVQAMANAESWVRIMAPQIIEHMDAGNLDGARDLIEQCPENLPPGTALTVLNARLALATERYEEASAGITRALEDYPLGGNAGRRAELCWLDFLAMDALGKTIEADKRLLQAYIFAKELVAAIPEIQTISTMCRREHYIQQDEHAKATIQRGLCEAIARADEAEVYEHRDIVMHGFASLVPNHLPKLRRRLSMVTGEAYDHIVRQRLKPANGQDWQRLVAHARDVPEPLQLSTALLEKVENSQLTTSEIVNLFSIADK
ncbi:MAG: ATP-binding protein, partial [Pseudomonadota bacterium]